MSNGSERRSNARSNSSSNWDDVLYRTPGPSRPTTYPGPQTQQHNQESNCAQNMLCFIPEVSLPQQQQQQQHQQCTPQFLEVVAGRSQPPYYTMECILATNQNVGQNNNFQLMPSYRGNEGFTNNFNDLHRRADPRDRDWREYPEDRFQRRVNENEDPDWALAPYRGAAIDADNRALQRRGVEYKEDGVVALKVPCDTHTMIVSFDENLAARSNGTGRPPNPPIYGAPRNANQKQQPQTVVIELRNSDCGQDEHQSRVRQPAIGTCAPQPAIGTCAPQPAVKTCAPQPAVETCAPQPAVRTCAPQPAVETCAPQPAVGTCAPQPSVHQLNCSDTVPYFDTLDPNLCPYCGVGVFVKKTSVTGYLAAILCFPCGLYCCLAKTCYIVECTFCHATSERDPGQYR